MATLSKTIKVFSNGSVGTSRDGTYYIVNPDYDQVWSSVEFPNRNKKVSRPTRNGTPYNAVSGRGLPATARFVDDKPVKFFRDLQFWVHGLCSEKSGQSEAENKKDFASLWRDNGWMTNFAGTWTRADYINGNGMPPEIQQQPMACGGSLLRYVGDTVVRQTQCILIEAINPEVEYRKYHPSTHPWLFFRPTISAREWIFDSKNNVIEKREWFNEPFDDYGENAVVPIYGFREDKRSSTGWCNVIETYRVKLLPPESPVPNPFVIRGRTKENPYAGF